MDLTSTALAEGDLRGLEPALLRSAMALTDDPVEARALVAQTLATAADERRRGRGEVERIRLFRLLRQAYHSVERTRTRRPTRDAALTALAGAVPREA